MAGYSVGQVAAFAGVTVRTLHHYDEIGLLSPSERTAAGYRRYAEPDLDRLQQVLFYRELGFPLEEITAILDDPGVDAATHLRRQHELLRRRIARLEALVVSVETAMEAARMGVSLTPEERYEVFGEFRPEDHAEEAESRWGGTSAWVESRRRTSSYSKADWEAIKAEAGGLVEAWHALFVRGAPAGSAEVTAVAERHREHIGRWFYECTYEIHVGLGEMYVADERFARNYEGVAEGLAAYIRDSIAANAAAAR
ncbi:MerR family transcriptional regulator [Herbidospora galbida]|uniref:MerR family transcriptional regulator n=1 Tax=Herbidospora galbida TaxID=2575442 RepID=A0A4V5V069_9ACTN|nr:MerR family transcriptional regulator [Herbidospora galbida]TKK91243.1 MerR family transcriptional regulator [Herbidospora galbida]